jgi:hypothetical protein
MDCSTLEQKLTEAKSHLALGVEHIARQREYLARLERRGMDTYVARVDLGTLLLKQWEHLAQVGRLRAELRRQSN